MKSIYKTALFLLLISATCFARINFIHVPYSSCEEVQCILEKKFHASEVYLQKIERPFFKKTPFLFQFEDYEFVSGPFSLDYLKKNDPSFSSSILVTVIRNPMTRLLYQLRSVNRKVQDKLDFSQMDLDLLPRMLCTNPDYLKKGKNTRPSEEDLFQHCISNLKKFDYIFFSDHEKVLEEGIEDFLHKLQVPGHIEIGSEITFDTLPKPSKKILDQLEKKCRLDIRIYQFALKHFSKEKRIKKDISKRQYFNHLQALLETKHKMQYQFEMPLSGKGWHKRESDKESSYAYIRSKNATFECNVSKDEDYQLDFFARVICPDVFPFAIVNGIRLPVRRENLEGFSKYIVFIPKRIINQGHLKIEFCANKKYRLNKFYPHIKDRRSLSYAVNRIELNPVTY